MKETMGAQLLVVAVIASLFFATANSYLFFHNIKFSYDGANGPESWGKLSPDFAACSNGKIQSPINIGKQILSLNQNLPCLTRDYKDVNATLVNNGFNIGILMEGDAGVLVANGKNYSLKQVHWHTPAEHTINGVRHAAELHLVHVSDDGAFSVVSILFQLGSEDSFLAQITDKLQELTKEVCEGHEEAHIPLGIFDTKFLQRETNKYFKYVGSLTVPPCTENVTWSILGKVREISQEQLDALKAPLEANYKKNARPLQPLNGRTVELYKKGEF